MKKTTLIITSILMMMTLVSCGNHSTANNMIIQPSHFSKETEHVLQIIDDELVFFDYSVDETIKSCSINIWIYENGEWISSGSTYGNVESGQQQIAIGMTDNSYDIFQISESGHTKSSFESVADFSYATLIETTRLTIPTEIKANKEIPLWVVLGTNQSCIGSRTDNDFRDSSCSAGAAITITFSDEEVD